MTRTTKALAAVAVAALAIAPVAAQAGTRAASSPVTVDVSRGADAVAGESDFSGRNRNIAWLLLLLAAVIAIVIAATGKTRGG